MKKFIISAFALLLTLATVTAEAGRLGYQGNSVNTTVGTQTSTGRFGHQGENPTTNQNWKDQQQNKNAQRRNWNQNRQGTRATTGTMYRTIAQ